MRFYTFILIIFAVLSFAGCSSNVTVPESNVSILRIKLVKLQLIEPSTDHNVERVKYTGIAKQAENMQAFNIAASAYSMLGNYYENLSITSIADKQTSYLNNALKYYQKALYLDKKEQKLLASASNPFPNADKIAISLNNISFVYEKLGEVDKAIKYAERAFSINRNLEYILRVIKDCERLIRLYGKIGKEKSVLEYENTLKEYEILLAKRELTENSSE